MKILQWLGILSPAHIQWFNLVKPKTLVGTDPSGNRYYKGRPRPGYTRERRWVMYAKTPEPSAVHAEWHGWLHYQTDTLPCDQTAGHRRPWQKPHSPNLTGTDHAYRPPGYALSSGTRDSATGDYDAWSPPPSSRKHHTS